MSPLEELKRKLRERDRRIAKARKILQAHHWPTWAAEAYAALEAPRGKEE